jgi:hypothetical protein
MRMQVMAVADRIAQMRKSFSHSCLVLGNFGRIGELILTSLRGCFDALLQRMSPLVPPVETQPFSNPTSKQYRTPFADRLPYC